MAINIGGHLGRETLEAYAVGTIPEDSVAELEEHLLVCRECQVRLDETEQFVSIAQAACRQMRQEARAPQKEPGLAWLFRIPRPVWAGAFAVLLMTLAVPAWRQVRTGPAITTEVKLQTSRGGEKTTAQVAHGSVILVADVRELPQMPEFLVRVVRQDGSALWQGTTPAVDHKIRQQIPNYLSSGQYWVRIYSADGSNLLREFALQVK